MTTLALIAHLATYVLLLRVPLLIGTLAIALPILAFYSPAKSLLRGLFDVTPPSMLAVTLAAAALSGTVSSNSKLIFLHAHQRIPSIPSLGVAPSWVWTAVTLAVCLPIILSALTFSARQGNGTLGLISMAALGLGAALVLQNVTPQLLANLEWKPVLSLLQSFGGAFRGYFPDPADPASENPFPDHIAVTAGFLVAFIFYIGIGIYGRFRLGKRHTVPALCSALLVLMLLSWSLSGLTFFLDAWRIPVVLVLVAAGILTTQSKKSDHFYQLKNRTAGAVPAPDPQQVVSTVASGRIVVVAANGGGIQAAAWAAQVLQGLTTIHQDKFTGPLSLISSVSGGSVGAAYFLYSIANPALAADPALAAAKSSLDEVTWGLAWPDLFRSILPWFSGSIIGRGRALEEAWCLNGAQDISKGSHLDRPLSDWNAPVAGGKLPAVIFNATLCETGERLLLGTTCLKDQLDGRARVDATELHKVNGVEKDVAAVTAARLSATFPYVTPASRSDAPGPQPHVVDGGYYDNYGMSTLVEWLDEALHDHTSVKSVLVIQIHGAPVGDNQPAARHSKNRGWFYQAIAPLATLAAVRDTGQIAHNDLELELLQEKWFAHQIPIHSVTFEFPDPEAPLSWHLTPEQQRNVINMWSSSTVVPPSANPDLANRKKKLEEYKEKVALFLNGSDSLNCNCPKCRLERGLPATAKAATA